MNFAKKNKTEIRNTINIFCAEKNKLIIRQKMTDNKKLMNRSYKFNLIFISAAQSILSDVKISRLAKAFFVVHDITKNNNILWKKKWYINS